MFKRFIRWLLVTLPAFMPAPAVGLLCSTLLIAGCSLHLPPITPVPPAATLTVYTFGIVACGAVVEQTAPCPIPLADAIVHVNSLSGYVSQVTNNDGYTQFTSTIPYSDVKVTAEGYQPLAVAIQPPQLDGRNITLSLVTADVDPARYSLNELAAIRGAMWALGPVAGLPGGLPLGPRPGQPDNVIGTVFITNYTEAEQDAIITELKARGYTHVVMGPLVDSDGYHGIWRPNDWRGANWDRFLDAHQKFYNAGLKVVTYGKPDGWWLDQFKAEFTALLSTPRAQKLIRIFVPMGWEAGGDYEYSSCTWAEAGRWGREVLPNALMLVHMVSDRDAPAGGDALCNDDDKTWNPNGNAAAWGRVVPFYHGWLTQSNAFENPTATGGDREHPELTNFQNWQRQFDPTVKGSYRDRFEHGYAGWPRNISAWGDQPLRVFAGEYSAYWRFWHHRTEAEGVLWGDAAMAAGAAGYLDSGSVPVGGR